MCIRDRSSSRTSFAASASPRPSCARNLKMASSTSAQTRASSPSRKSAFISSPPGAPTPHCPSPGHPAWLCPAIALRAPLSASAMHQNAALSTARLLPAHAQPRTKVPRSAPRGFWPMRTDPKIHCSPHAYPIGPRSAPCVREPQPHSVPRHSAVAPCTKGAARSRRAASGPCAMIQ